MRHAARALCLTPACIQLASDYILNLSPNYKKLDACTNFEEMVCGGFRNRYELGNNTMVTIFNMIDQTGTDRLRAVIEGPYPGESNHSHFSPRSLHAREASIDQQNFATMKLAYASCMDENAIAEAGTRPISELLNGLEATFRPDDWSESYLFIQRLQVGGLLNLVVSRDIKDPYNRVISIPQRAGVGLSSLDAYQKPEVVEEYTAVLAEIFTAIHPSDSPLKDVKRVAEDLVKFETALAKIAVPSLALRDPQEGGISISISEASKLIPQLKLEKIIRQFAPAGYSPTNLTVANTTFLSDLSRILSETHPDIIKAFFTWRTITAVQDYVIAPSVFDRWNKLQYQLKLATPPSDNPTERWKFCMGYVNDNLGWILSRFFIEGFFSARDKGLSEQIISDIRHVYTDKFKNLDWMDAETKKKAAEKVERMVQKLGYPTESPNITSPVSLQQYYSTVTITASYFSNTLSLVNFSASRPWSRLGQPYDHKAWSMLATDINASYDSGYNEILFPAGILQSPFFNGNLPSVVNYGAFGSVAGHEISHAFDNNGRKFDADGRQTDWWGNATLREYERRVGCFVRQFGNYTVTIPGKELKVNGSRTLGENIADSAGAVVAYEAWQRRRAAEPNELALPGLEGVFTEEQLFFVSFANMWCTKYSPQGLARYERDMHSPGPARVQGTMENSRAFRKAFGCQVKEPTCELW